MNEENLLQTIIKQESWDDLIVHIVTMENLDPWDVDLVKLTESFVKYIESLERLDFRIPAKVVLVAAILLKLKSEILNPLIKPIENGASFNSFNLEMDDFDDIKQRLSQVELKPGVMRKVKRKVTLDELVDALKKAVKVHDRRKEKKTRLGRRLNREINVDEEDIEKRIMALLDDIDNFLVELDEGKVEFSKVVKEWNRDEIISHFMPLLHLATRGDITAEQEDFFKEIFISKKQ
jgi:segregation and condensation protein A